MNTSGPSWDVVRDRNDLAADVHVVPVNDTIEHVEVRQCWCRPALEQTGLRTIVIHNSADGREHFEPDHAEDEHTERPS